MLYDAVVLAVTMVAKRIFELAKRGERNPRRLRDYVLTSFRHGFDGKV